MLILISLLNRLEPIAGHKKLHKNIGDFFPYTMYVCISDTVGYRFLAVNGFLPSILVISPELGRFPNYIYIYP